MSINVGDRMPAGRLIRMGDRGPEPIAMEDLFDGNKVLLFAVPGAFTPTCSARHLPGYIRHAQAIKEKGVDTIACMAVNDVHVMTAWAEAAGAGDDILMLADGNGTYATALGLDTDSSAFGMGKRSRRFSMLVDDGIVTLLNVDPPGEFGATSAETLLEQLG